MEKKKEINKTSESVSKKLKVGVLGISGCAGCLLSVVFQEEILDLVGSIDLISFPLIKGKNSEENFDLVLFEGVVCSKDDLEKLKKVREKTKILVALGACAHTGGIPGMRNFIPQDKYKHLEHKKQDWLSDVGAKPINEFVKVDFYLPGCPPSKPEILYFFKQLLLNKAFKDYDKPVCYECRLNQNRCLLEDKKLCFGPITRGGCNSICTNYGLECWGCRGSTDDTNIDELYELLKENGFDIELIRDRIETFVGVNVKEIDVKIKERFEKFKK